MRRIFLHLEASQEDASYDIWCFATVEEVGSEALGQSQLGVTLRLRLLTYLVEIHHAPQEHI